MMQPQSTLFRGPNEHVGPLKKDQCALTPKTCPLRKALQWGEGRVRGRVTLDKPVPLTRAFGATSPRWGEVEQEARPCLHYLIASGLTGEPTAPVIGIAGPTNMNS